MQLVACMAGKDNTYTIIGRKYHGIVEYSNQRLVAIWCTVAYLQLVTSLGCTDFDSKNLGTLAVVTYQSRLGQRCIVRVISYGTKLSCASRNISPHNYMCMIWTRLLVWRMQMFQPRVHVGAYRFVTSDLQTSVVLNFLPNLTSHHGQWIIIADV